MESVAFFVPNKISNFTTYLKFHIPFEVYLNLLFSKVTNIILFQFETGMFNIK